MFITSLLDTDFYTFTMGQAVLFNYPNAWVKYKFKCRNNKDTLGKMDQRRLTEIIQDEIIHFCDLSFTQGELRYLSRISFLKPEFIRALSRFKAEPTYVTCEEVDEEMSIIIEGPWFETIWFEVPVLAMISECYSGGSNYVMDGGLLKLQKDLKKIEDLDDGFKFADGGTRRRFSKHYQQEVLRYIAAKHPGRLAGTSNVLFAKEMDMKPIGTMAHQWLQAHQAFTNIRNSQFEALDVWARTYRGDLGIALSDVFGFDAFLNDFDKYFAKLFDGCRHDSGSPFTWADKLIKHYEKYFINSKTRTGVFSNELTFELMANLYRNYSIRLNTSFLIGTELVGRPWEDYIAPQIVIKMVECNNQPVAKVPDSAGKGMCEDPNFLQYVKSIFNIT